MPPFILTLICIFSITFIVINSHTSVYRGGKARARSSNGDDPTATFDPISDEELCACFDVDSMCDPMQINEDEVCYYYRANRQSSTDHCSATLQSIVLNQGVECEDPLTSTEIQQSIVYYAPQCYAVGVSEDGGVQVTIDSDSSSSDLGSASTSPPSEATVAGGSKERRRRRNRERRKRRRLLQSGKTTISDTIDQLVIFSLCFNASMVSGTQTGTINITIGNNSATCDVDSILPRFCDTGSPTAMPTANPTTAEPTTASPTSCESTCSLSLEPVCGANGVSFDNDCLAICAGIVIDYEGPCTEAPTTANPTTSEPTTIFPSGSPTSSATASPITLAPTSPGIIECGILINGDYNDEPIWFPFFLTVQSSVEFSTCGSNFDTYLELWDQTKLNLLDSDEFGCVPEHQAELITITPLEPGQYFLYLSTGSTIADDEQVFSNFRLQVFCPTASPTIPLPIPIPTEPPLPTRAPIPPQDIFCGEAISGNFENQPLYFRFDLFLRRALVTVSPCGSSFDLSLIVSDSTLQTTLAECDDTNSNDICCHPFNPNINGLTIDMTQDRYYIYLDNPRQRIITNGEYEISIICQELSPEPSI